MKSLRLNPHTQSYKSFGAWSRFYSGNKEPNLKPIPKRVQDLRDRLEQERKPYIFEISQGGKDFLKEVTSDLNHRYSRGGDYGEGYIGVKKSIKVAADGYYSDNYRKSLLNVSDAAEKRMRVKISESYLNHALNIPKEAKEPNPILKVVMPDAQEIADLSGEIDPSNQNRYSPLPGLLHKYEMLLAMVAINCSSHCRYCYRLDLFNGSSGKSKADMQAIAAYIKTFNQMIDVTIERLGLWNNSTATWLHRDTKEPLMHVREILFSGGDPMTLPNATIARYMVLMAEAGIENIRIGTKELVFNPQRFDDSFWKMMDLFHKEYPRIELQIVGHYVHPYELINARVDSKGRYLYDTDLDYVVRKDLEKPLYEIDSRKTWIRHRNQFPIISGINDTPATISLLIRKCSKMGIEMHNIYACREIPGNKHFRADNTISKQFNLLKQAKSKLSGIDNHGRLIMSTEYGKMAVVGVDGYNVILELNRLIHGQIPEQSTIIVDTSKLPEGEGFYWLTDDVIDRAVSGKGKKVLQKLRSDDDSFIAKLKKAAAASVLGEIPQNDNEQKPVISCGQRKVSIEIIGRNGGSEFLEINLDDEKYKAKKPTLATALAKRGEVDATCKEQLSCSTCVGEVESDQPIKPASEDEMDLIDSVTPKSVVSAKSAQSLRASCQIELEEDVKYKFTHSEFVANKGRS